MKNKRRTKKNFFVNYFQRKDWTTFYLKTLSFITGVFLLSSIFAEEELIYSFSSTLACFTALVLAYATYCSKLPIWTVIFIIIAIGFNPFSSIAVSQAILLAIYTLASGCFLFLSVQGRWRLRLKKK